MAQPQSLSQSLGLFYIYNYCKIGVALSSQLLRRPKYHYIQIYTRNLNTRTGAGSAILIR